MKIRNLMWSLFVVLLAGIARGESPTAKAANAKSVAQRAWTITDLVLEQDIDPPARQQMLLHGLKALLRQAPGRTMPNLSARVSGVTTPEQFAALMAEVWPTDDANGEEREHVLFRGLFDWRQMGKEESAYLSPQQVKAYEVQAGNRYVGTGIQIRNNDKEKLTQIVIPFPGGPGARPVPGPAT